MIFGLSKTLNLFQRKSSKSKFQQELLSISAANLMLSASIPTKHGKTQDLMETLPSTLDKAWEMLSSGGKLILQKVISMKLVQ